MLFHPVSIHLVNFNTVYTQVHVRPNVSAHFELPHTRNKKKKGIKEDLAHTKKLPSKTHSMYLHADYIPVCLCQVPSAGLVCHYYTSGGDLGAFTMTMDDACTMTIQLRYSGGY